MHKQEEIIKTISHDFRKELNNIELSISTIQELSSDQETKQMIDIALQGCTNILDYFDRNILSLVAKQINYDQKNTTNGKTENNVTDYNTQQSQFSSFDTVNTTNGKTENNVTDYNTQQSQFSSFDTVNTTNGKTENNVTDYNTQQSQFSSFDTVNTTNGKTENNVTDYNTQQSQFSSFDTVNTEESAHEKIIYKEKKSYQEYLDEIIFLCNKSIHQIMHKMLIVEDNKNNSLVVKSILSKLNHSVHSCIDATTAYKTLEKEQFYMILLDIKLPDDNGLRVSEAIRMNTEYFLNKNAVIIAVSGFITSDNLQEITESGCNDYIRKPYRRIDIINKVEKWYLIKQGHKHYQRILISILIQCNRQLRNTISTILSTICQNITQQQEENAKESITALANEIQNIKCHELAGYILASKDLIPNKYNEVLPFFYILFETQKYLERFLNENESMSPTGFEPVAN